MMNSRLEVAIIRKLIDGGSVNGRLTSLTEPWCEIAQAIMAAPKNPTLRTQAFEAVISGRPDAAEIREGVFNADPGILDDQSNAISLLITTTDEPDELLKDGRELQTDLGNSRRFASQHSGKVCYVESLGFMFFDGQRWGPDETGAAWRLARQTARGIYHEATAAFEEVRKAVQKIEETAQSQCEKSEAETKTAVDQKAKTERVANSLLSWALRSQQSSRLEAMLRLARSEPEICARAADFDRNPWLLNVQNGIVDLRTGELRDHDPVARFTRLAGAVYDPTATCPTWKRFLERIFDNDDDLIGFIQRAAGYSLTGDTGEQCLFFLYGIGANGKSTFTGALQDVLGDYAIKTRAETLMTRKNDVIPEEIAQLAGVRFMLAAELGEGQRLNESLIKDLTGGDKLRGRLLYQKSFEYYPIAKPWLYGNHKPIIRGTDEGIWRRPKLIPFTVTIPPEERDKELPQKLRMELPGILAWALRGCLDWQHHGLQTPAKVTAATDDFRAEQDILGTFLNDCCVVDSKYSVTAGELYISYKSWAVESGLEPLSKIGFSRQLTERGYRTEGRQPGSGRALYPGLGLQMDIQRRLNL